MHGARSTEGHRGTDAPARAGLTGTIVREPLVQFLAIGAVLAGLYAQLPDAAAPMADQERIVVGEGEVEQLRQLFLRTWQRPPSPEEMDGLLVTFVREEVLYRAGQALGLDADDPVVRRRIAQKMEVLLEPAPGDLVPTEDDLARHLAAHRERFRRPARISVDQITIDSRPDVSQADAAAEVLAALRRGGDPAALGRPTLLPATFEDETDEALARTIGDAFAATVLAAPVGAWTGPVPSPFGIHLVRVRERVPARDSDLSEVRAAVAADWEATRRREVADERFEALKRGYTVEVARGAQGAAVADAGAPSGGKAR